MKLKKYKRFYNEEGAICPGLPNLFEAVLVPKNILEILQKIFLFNKDNIVSYGNDNKNLVKFLNNLFNPFRIFFEETNEIIFGVTITKSFYSTEYNKIILYVTKDSNVYLLQNFNIYWNGIKSMLGHELIHQMQFLNQKIKNNYFPSLKDEIKYYSNKQEIMAFAWQTIFLFLCFGKNKNEIIKALKDKNDKNNIYNTTIQKYNTLFKNEDKTMKIYKKYCFEYLNKML